MTGFSAAIRRGLIEAHLGQPSLRTRGFPRRFAAASLKRDARLRAAVPAFSAAIAAASLKHVVRGAAIECDVFRGDSPRPH